MLGIVDSGEGVYQYVCLIWASPLVLPGDLGSTTLLLASNDHQL